MLKLSKKSPCCDHEYPTLFVEVSSKLFLIAHNHYRGDIILIDIFTLAMFKSFVEIDYLVNASL